MSKRLKSTLIASAVTIVWFVLMFFVNALGVPDISYSADAAVYTPFFRVCLWFFKFCIRFMCACAVPAAFITVYELFYKEDLSWFKYKAAAIFFSVFMCVFYVGGEFYISKYNPNIFSYTDSYFFGAIGLFFILVVLCIAIYEGGSRAMQAIFGKVCEDRTWAIVCFVFLTLVVIISSLISKQNLYDLGFIFGDIDENHHRVYTVILIAILTILPMFLIYLRGRGAENDNDKTVIVKNRIDTSVLVNYIPMVAMALSVVIYSVLPRNGTYYHGSVVYEINHETGKTISIVLGVLFSLAGGILFLSVYESRRSGKGILKYIQWVVSQYLALFVIFNILNADYCWVPTLYAAIFTAVSLVPVIICLITELKGKPLTQKIVAGVKKLNEKPQGDRVKPERLSEVRRVARTRLGGGIFTGGWLLMALAAIIYSALSGLVAFTLIGAILVIGPITYGLAKTEMNVVTGKKAQADLADIFSGFSECFTQSVVLWLLQTIFLSLWSMLFVVPGIIKYYAYSMAFYVQAHSENKNWRYALKESQRLMYGNKFKLFLLDLSFIGWYILGSACLGIGVLFVVPYHKTAKAAFFNSLFVADEKVKQEKAVKEIVAAESDTGATACEEAACGETA